MLVHTPLYKKHLALGAKMIDFFGYKMPLQYSGIMIEHKCVRNIAGVFDLSHMGEILVGGEGASEFLNYVTTNNVTSLKPGAIQYNLLTNDQGGIIDDILVYRLPEAYYLVVNAANKDKDYRWLLDHVTDDAYVKDLSPQTALIAVQGPYALRVVEKVLGQSVGNLRYYSFADLDYGGETIRVSRTGYTGEDGFEIYHSPQLAGVLWDDIFAAGQLYQIQPIGLGARDTLRLEMRMPLYGNELTEKTTPLQAGLSRVVDFAKGDFIGRDYILKEKAAGNKQKLIGFELLEKGISRHGYEITDQERRIGYVTSGSISPGTGKSIGLGYVNNEYAKTGEIIYISIRKQQIPAKIVKGRFVETSRKT